MSETRSTRGRFGTATVYASGMPPAQHPNLVRRQTTRDLKPPKLDVVERVRTKTELAKGTRDDLALPPDVEKPLGVRWYLDARVEMLAQNLVVGAALTATYRLGRAHEAFERMERDRIAAEKLEVEKKRIAEEAYQKGFAAGRLSGMSRDGKILR